MANNIYNLIILDRSGSMCSIRKEAIAGVNETIGSIRATARKNPDSKQYVSLLLFCGCTINYVYENCESSQVKEFSAADYEPCCSTPLYDAIGNSCTTLHKLLKGDPDANVSVTIITDGYENASKEWNHQSIASLIKMYRNEGWLFAYIGADHDVEKVAMQININNTLRFEKSTEGTKEMFRKYGRSRTAWADQACCAKMPTEANNSFFKE